MSSADEKSTLATLRASQSLADVPEELRQPILEHPYQSAAVNDVASLLGGLRSARNAADFVELQDDLIELLSRCDTRRATASRVIKRLANGKALPSNIDEPPSGRDPLDPTTWEIERYVEARTARQLRSVGDALAWTALEHNRTYIFTLGSNTAPGQWIDTTRPRPSAAGREAELAVAKKAFAERGRFGLLHDVTNCLRIGDLTEVDGDGFESFEVKAGGQKARTAQKLRMSQAAQSIAGEGTLPGSATAIAQLETSYQSNIKVLRDIADLADERGAQGARVADGVALVVLSLIGHGPNLFKSDPRRLMDRYAAQRVSAHRRAGIISDEHQVRVTSNDLAGRHPMLPPWGIYPLTTRQCAGLICDLVMFETTIAIDAIGRAMQRHGLSVTAFLQPGHSNLDPAQPVLKVTDGVRVQSIYSNALTPLMYELVTLDAFARSTVELLAREPLLPQVLPRFTDDHKPWVSLGA